MASYKQTVWKTELLHEGNLQMNKLKKNKTVEQYLKNQYSEKRNCYIKRF